jgi:hypothetical protein
MIPIMMQRLIVSLLSAGFILFTPLLALAQDEEGEKYDARLEGYGPSATLDSSATALMWLLLIVLAALCVGVMFKNARRTHLD